MRILPTGGAAKTARLVARRMMSRRTLELDRQSTAKLQPDATKQACARGRARPLYDLAMPLSAGTRVGSYQIEAAIGVGGMSACGCRAERVIESRVGSERGWGPRERPRNDDDFAHAGVR